MTDDLPIENKHLPANHQDVGGIDARNVEAINKVNFGGKEFSPPPTIRETARAVGEMNFYEALQKVVGGAKVTRVSWEHKEIFAQMLNEFLYLKDKRGKLSIWGISEGDMIGTDYVVID